MYYSVMGLDASKGFDLILDESSRTAAVQSETECKKTDFDQSLLPVNMFFALFSTITDYMGLNADE